jgi:hypothetical protein
MRKGAAFNWFVGVAVALVIGVAVADSLWPNGGSSSKADQRVADQEVVQLLPQEKVAEIRWAHGLSEGSSDCRYMTQPLCERIACARPGPVTIPNCKRPTQAYRRSFAEETVQEVVFKHNRAAARFSNDQVVEFWGDAGTWSVNKLGGKGVRELFEMNGVRHYLMTPEGKSTLYWRTLGKESAEETAVSGQSCIWKCTT